MIPAKNNIIIKIQDTNEPEYAVMNPITGSFDLMGGHEYQLFQKLTEGEALPDDFSAYLLERGYAYDHSEAQNNAINKAYEDFNNWNSLKNANWASTFSTGQHRPIQRN